MINFILELPYYYFLLTDDQTNIIILYIIPLSGYEINYIKINKQI